MNTTANNRRIAKNTIILYLRMILLMLVSLYTSRVILSALGIEDYGIYNVVGGVVAMFGFINGAMATGTQRYLTFELGRKNYSRLRSVFITSVNIHLLIAFVVIILAETVGLWFLNNKMVIPDGRASAAMWVYQFSVVSTAVMFVSVPYNATIVAHERMSVFAYISIFEAIMKLSIALMLYVFNGDKLILYGFMLLCVQVMVRIVYGIYCRRHFMETKYKFRFEKSLFLEMLSFSGWNLWGSSASIAMTQGLNILLNIFFGPVVNAARGVATQVQSVVIQFASNFQTALNPQIIKSYASKELCYMHSLIFRSSRFSFYLLFCLCLPVFIETDVLLRLWLKEVPEYSSVFLRLILCASIIQSVSGPFMMSAQATGKVKVYQSVVGCILIMVLPAAYTVLKLGGSPQSVFVAEIAVCVVAFIARLLIVRSIIHFSLRKFFTDVILRCVLVSITAAIFPLLLNKFLQESLVTSLAVCAVSVIFALISALFIGMTCSERITILKTVQNKLHINNKIHI